MIAKVLNDSDGHKTRGAPLPARDDLVEPIRCPYGAVHTTPFENASTVSNHAADRVFRAQRSQGGRHSVRGASAALDPVPDLRGNFLHGGLEVHIMRRSHRMKRIMREQWGQLLPSTLQQVDEVQSFGVLTPSHQREKDSAVEPSSRPLSLRRAC
jgi:hypothetical protein